MEARGVHAALAAMRNKTDKNDVRGIAQILRTGWYQTVHVKSIESHHVRALLSSRKAVLNKCIDLENMDERIPSATFRRSRSLAARRVGWIIPRG